MIDKKLGRNMPMFIFAGISRTKCSKRKLILFGLATLIR